MTLRERLALAICVALHAYVLWNVWEADKLTPRVINLTRDCFQFDTGEKHG